MRVPQVNSNGCISWKNAIPWINKCFQCQVNEKVQSYAKFQMSFGWERGEKWRGK